MIYFAVNGVTDIDNYKKIKRNNFDERLHETSSTVTSVIVAHNTNDTNSTININITNEQQNESTSASKSGGHEDKELSKCTSETMNSTLNMVVNQNKLLTQSMPFHKADSAQHLNHIISYLKKNGVSVCEEKNSVAHQSSEYVPPVTDSELSRLLFQVPPINGFYLQRVENSSLTINQSAIRTDRTRTYAIPTSMILPHVTDNIVLDNQIVSVNQPIMVSAPTLNNNQISSVNQQEATLKGNVSVSIGNNFSNKSYVSNSLRNSKIIMLSTQGFFIKH